MSNLKAPNEEQQKFLNELQADPKLGTKYTELLIFAMEALAKMARVKQSADLANYPEREETVDMLTKVTAIMISESTDKDFPDDKPIHVKLRHDITHYLKLCGALDPDDHWDDERREMVKSN